MPRILMLCFDDAANDAPPPGCDAGTELVIRPIAGAPCRRSSAQDWSLADLAVMAAGQDAQGQGFDALCLPAFGDYGVAALRSLLDIPVVPGGRGTMLHALTLAGRFGIVTGTDGHARAARLVQDYGLAAQCAGIVTCAEDSEAAELAACRAVLASGAEVVCLADRPEARAEALGLLLPAPVLSSPGLCVKWAESLLGLRLSQSRRAFPEPQVRKPELIRALMAASISDRAASQSSDR